MDLNIDKYFIIIFLFVVVILIVKYDNYKKISHFSNIKKHKKKKLKKKLKKNNNNDHVFHNLIDKIKEIKELSKLEKLNNKNKKIEDNIDNFSNISEDDNNNYIEFQSSMNDRNNILPILKYKTQSINFPIFNNHKINYYHNYKEIDKKKDFNLNILKNQECPSINFYSNKKKLYLFVNKKELPSNNNMLNVLFVRCVDTFLFDGNTSLKENICYKKYTDKTNNIINEWLDYKMKNWDSDDINSESIAYNKVIILGDFIDFKYLKNIYKLSLIYFYNDKNDVIRTLFIVKNSNKIDISNLFNKNEIINKIEIISIKNKNNNIFDNKKFKNTPLVFFNKINDNIYDMLEIYETDKVKLGSNDIIKSYYEKNKIHYLIPKKSIVNLDQRYCLYCELNNNKQLLSNIKFLSLIEGTEVKVFKKDFFTGNDCSLDKLYN